MRHVWQVPLSVLLALLVVAAVGPTSAAVAGLALAATAPELARVDLAEHRLPNRMVAPGLAAGLAATAVTGVATGAVPIVPLAAAIATGALLLALGIRGGMGMGDVKLAALIGLASPTLSVALLSPLIAFVAGGVAAAVALIRGGRGTTIAFGPFLLAGYVVALVLEVTRMGR